MHCAGDATFSTSDDNRQETLPSDRLLGCRWDSLPVDIIQAIAAELPLDAAREIRLVNRHWSVAARSLIRSVVVDTKYFTHHSQLGSYVSRLADGTYCRLRQLKLSSQFRSGYECLKQLTSLTSLDLSACYANTHELSGIAGLTNLMSLGMGWTQLTDAGVEDVAELEGLTSLSLEWCRISESSLERMCRLTKLSRLNICGFPYTSTECLRPLESHMELTFLDLSWIYLTGEALLPVSKLSKLTHLNLAMNPLNCDAMHVISGLTQLRKLNLKKTNVGNEGLRSLTSLVRLRRLDLSGTAVDDRGLLALTHLGLLSSLDLSDNYMVGWNDLEHLMPLTSLIFLHQLYLQKTQANSTTAEAFAGRFRPKKLLIEF